MDRDIELNGKILFLLFLELLVFFPLTALAGQTPTMAIEEAKFAIDEARKFGADRKAYDDRSAAKSWLVRAEKEYTEAKSSSSRVAK